MLGKNETPFAAIAFEQVHRDGKPMAVIAVRGSFEITADGKMKIADKQAIVLADEYDIGQRNGRLKRVSDLVPYKPATDITMIGNSYPPGGDKSTGWPFGIVIGARSHSLRCNGYRLWESAEVPEADGKAGSSSSRWRLGAPQAISYIPMDYRYAAGGQVIGAPKHKVDRRNPYGVGTLYPDLQELTEPTPAPLVDSITEPVVDPFIAPEPQGTAPVLPAWLWRQRYAGTFDEAWKMNRHPQLPTDFDYRFYQTAHPELIWPGYLRGDERFRLINMSRISPTLGFHLPAKALIAHFEWLDERRAEARLNLDGVHIDTSDDAVCKIDITWRGWIGICPRFFKIDLQMTDLGNPILSELPTVGEGGLQDVAATSQEARP